MRTFARGWRRLDLAQRYMVASLAVFLSVAGGGGWWITREIQDGVVHRTAETTALYVESFVSPSLRDLGGRDGLSPGQIAMLNRLLEDTPLGREIVAFKIWSTDGRVLYSNEPDVLGRQYPITPALAAARDGVVVSEISALDQEENLPERKQQYSSLLETYSPVRATADGPVVAVVEFYQAVDQLQDDLANTRVRVWLAVSATMLTAYLVLAGLVQRGSDTIGRQQRALAASVDQLTALLSQNASLHDRVRGAATRSTALNEQYLRRISADLHDGPAQDISVALLRLGSVARQAASPLAGAPGGRAAGGGASGGVAVGGGGGTADGDVATIEACLLRALRELRSIASGLRLPELESLSLTETVERVVQIHERRTGTSVALATGDDVAVSLPTKITVFRVIQEALANAYNHADGRGQRVRVTTVPDAVTLEVSDAGPGLAGTVPHASGRRPDRAHLGLAVMRERVESMGGRFSMTSRDGAGVTIRATLPLEPAAGVTDPHA